MGIFSSQKRGQEQTAAYTKIEQGEGKDCLQIKVEAYQTASALVIMAEVPGCDEENIDIVIDEDANTVVIRGSRTFCFFEDVDHDREYLCQECAWNDFYRKIILPRPIDADSSEAMFENGVLALRLPYLEE